MAPRTVLASNSQIRAQLLQRAGLNFEQDPARIDEEMLRQSFAKEAVSPRDQADALAEIKAQKVASRNSDALVLGCDQILACNGTVFAKPPTQEAACAHLGHLQNQRHDLFSAAVLYQDARPVWRIVDRVRLTMRPLSETQITAYVDRNWETIRHSVGGYMIEEEGIRLFSAIEGDYFSILGLPLLPLISYLFDRGFIEP